MCFIQMPRQSSVLCYHLLFYMRSIAPITLDHLLVCTCSVMIAIIAGRRKQCINLLQGFSCCLAIPLVRVSVKLANALTSGHMKYTKGITPKQAMICQIQIFHPVLSTPIPPAKTVINENSHSPSDPAAPPIWRYRRGAICGVKGSVS